MAEQGCTKIDFLFVIDNSGSMWAQQARLLNSFPGFIAAIQSSLGAVDSYHVGVITSDAYAYNAPECTQMGALVTRTQHGEVCTPFTQGFRFASEADDLAAKFPCMAQVGVMGSAIEQPVTAAAAALSDGLMQPGACNEGFLRDDAVLVLVFVTDDPPSDTSYDDAYPPMDVTAWHDAVVAAKHGDPEAMVVIGFVPWSDVSCVVLNLESPNLINFVQSFGPQGVLASICEPDFAPIFAETVGTIGQTCANFDPPG